MALQQSLRELEEELRRHKIEIAKLRTNLNELDKEKEAWFKKKYEASKKIRESIQKIKDNKTKRDSLTSEVKDLKQKRDKINEEIKFNFKGLNTLRKENIDIAKSLNIKISPSGIKRKIYDLEFKLQTEAMPFNKEQTLMKKIKELKKLYGDSGVLIDSNKRLKGASDEIGKMRREADEAHKLIQERAKQSQLLHEEILKISKEIDEIKVHEEEALKNFSEYKVKFNQVNAQLKERLKEMNNAKVSIDKMIFEKKEKRRIEQDSFLKSKEEEINKKIQRGGKLTTEDLLIFQHSKR